VCADTDCSAVPAAECGLCIAVGGNHIDTTCSNRDVNHPCACIRWNDAEEMSYDYINCIAVPSPTPSTVPPAPAPTPYTACPGTCPPHQGYPTVHVNCTSDLSQGQCQCQRTNSDHQVVLLTCTPPPAVCCIVAPDHRGVAGDPLDCRITASAEACETSHIVEQSHRRPITAHGIVLEGATACGAGVGCARCEDDCACLILVSSSAASSSSSDSLSVPTSSAEYAGGYVCGPNNLCTTVPLQGIPHQCFTTSETSSDK